MKSVVIILSWVSLIIPAYAQKADPERMERDIEVAENVLQTLIKQQFQSQRTFFPLDIEGSYQEGFGITFRFPANYTTPITIALGDNQIILDGNAVGGQWNIIERDIEDRVRIEIDDEIRLKERRKPARVRMDLDSLQKVYNEKVVEAARTFLLDYHDLLSQLPANERILITNRGEQPRMWINRYMSSPRRTLIEVEAVKGDLNQYRNGKLSREQMLSRIRILNTETAEAAEPDLELLSSILSRLYRSDLSKTYFSDNNVNYERLKNFGVVYYLRMYSSNQRGDRFDMPTVKMENVDQATRDKKVKELYPQFEKELKENIIEYGRTVKSLGDDEQLVINVRMTKCEGCGIPSTVEFSVKGSVLKDYSSGKITKETALSKVMVKKGSLQ
ncbi:MAG: hypothetical protein N2044_05960 [Cyclobacteriaceae bacterium]|nr:hypothetical protein [Cyclobacteriaceae bacterium]MCX7637376.1 hypothetical protein [Cyclobacteriaceae bacterium]MDW8330076.1 hypothetical protein [Cyclobacteriaceae bacterium]